MEVVSVGGACVDEERVGMAAKHPEQRREEVERRQMQRRLEGRRCGYLPGQGGTQRPLSGQTESLEPGGGEGRVDGLGRPWVRGGGRLVARAWIIFHDGRATACAAPMVAVAQEAS